MDFDDFFTFGKQIFILMNGINIVLKRIIQVLRWKCEAVYTLKYLLKTQFQKA